MNGGATSIPLPQSVSVTRRCPPDKIRPLPPTPDQSHSKFRITLLPLSLSAPGRCNAAASTFTTPTHSVSAICADHRRTFTPLQCTSRAQHISKRMCSWTSVAISLYACQTRIKWYKTRTVKRSKLNTTASFRSSNECVTLKCIDCFGLNYVIFVM